jgi:hypothetical protein
MDVNQKYCQSCHLISRNGFIITKIMSSQICCLMYGKCYHVSRMQLRRTQSIAEYAERFPERHHPGPRQLLI